MLELLAVCGTAIGGLGLFLLAIGMMTDGLKLAAGPSLRKILSDWSSTPLRGIFSGFLMTAIVQSSSAVTVASLGFVNAGLIKMRQALGIVFGANVGTTMTGWLVALVGFKFDIQAFAFPMIGVGMILKLVKQQGQMASIGMVLVGFGLFFIGIDVLKGAFESLVATFDISKLTADGITGILIFLLVGIVMTILTQSSSASIALTITAASSGIVGLYAAGAMVIGANVGTTSTAALASIGATSAAKRTAAAQVIFNVGTGMLALLLLPVMFYLIQMISDATGLSTAPAISLALFHTIFNLLGVVLVFPYIGRLSDYLDGKFMSREEMESKPRFLDNTIAQTPALAINALLMEMQGLGDRQVRLYEKAINPHNANLIEFDRDFKVLQTLYTEVSKFIVTIESSAMSEDTTRQLTTLMRVEQYFHNCTLATQRIAMQLVHRGAMDDRDLEQAVRDYLNQLLDVTRESLVNADYENEETRNFARIQSEHDHIKGKVLLAGTRGRISVGQMSDTLAAISEALNISQHWHKAVLRLNELRDVLQTELNGEEIKPDEPDQVAETINE